MKATLFFQGFKAGFQRFGHSVTNVINFILLTPVFFLGVGITSIIAKAKGKKFLDKDIKKDAETYWEDNETGNEKMEEYYRQF